MAEAQLLGWASQVPQGEKIFKASMGYVVIISFRSIGPRTPTMGTLKTTHRFAYE